MSASVTLPAAVEALRNTTSIIDSTLNRADRNNERKAEATTSLMRAITMTRFYLRDFSAGSRNYDRETAIYNAWIEASEKMQAVSATLAADCMFKANHWANPGPRPDRTVRKLDDILRDLTELIDPERKVAPSEEEFISLGLNRRD
jgi:hypothetical protein